MAAFTHLNPEGSRFSDGSYGVYYAAHELDTAIAEVSHHRAVFLSRTAEAAIDIDLRLVTATLDAPLHDLRRLRKQRERAVRPAALPRGAGAGRAVARRWQLGRGVSQRAPCRRPVRWAVQAARAEGGARERTHRTALGRRAHHALVRKARTTNAGLTPAAGIPRRAPPLLRPRLPCWRTTAPDRRRQIAAQCGLSEKRRCTAWTAPPPRARSAPAAAAG